MYKVSPKDRAQLTLVDHEQIPFVAILAPQEVQAGTVRIKEQVGKDASSSGGEKNRGEEVKLTEVVAYLKEKLGRA